MASSSSELLDYEDIKLSKGSGRMKSFSHAMLPVLVGGTGVVS